MTTFDADLLVAGGGPGGLAAALCARRQGLSVIVAEPRADPIDKACGEGLMPGGVAELAAIGVDPAGMPLAGIAYVGERHRAEARFSGPLGQGCAAPHCRPRSPHAQKNKAPNGLPRRSRASNRTATG